MCPRTEKFKLGKLSKYVIQYLQLQLPQNLIFILRYLEVL